MSDLIEQLESLHSKILKYCADKVTYQEMEAFVDLKESAKEPQEVSGDAISRKKLIEEIQLIAKELNKDKQNAEPDDSDLILAVDNQLSAIWRIKGVINNQPQVQPIVRSVEEIEKIVEAIYINMDCDDCPNRKKCSKIGANISCKDYWTAYLTGKEV